MKIAFVSTAVIPTPAPAELIQPGWTRSISDLIHDISEGLIAKGHEVTLFATGNSKTNGKLEYVWDKSAVEYEIHENQFDSFYMSYEEVLLSKCFEKDLTEHYDIIYVYHSYDSGIFSKFVNAPIVGTIHGPGSIHDEIFTSKIPNPSKYVGISDYQIKTMPYLKFVDKIYHGIDKELFKVSESNGENLVLVGRISEDKGTDLAIEAAKELNKTIDILGTTSYGPLMDKLKSIGGNVNFHGQKSKEEVKNIVGNSKAFIFPVRWNEPFGLVLIESLACGTPIIAYANGSLPEIVEDGKTGFLVNSDENNIRGDWEIKNTGIEGIKEALNKLYSLSPEEYLEMRKNCRKSFEEKFTKEIMIDNYERLFERIIQERK